MVSLLGPRTHALEQFARLSRLDRAFLVVLLLGLLVVLAILFKLMFLQTRDAMLNPVPKFHVNTLTAFPRVGVVVVSAYIPYIGGGISRCGTPLEKNASAPKARDFAIVKNIEAGYKYKFNFLRPSSQNVQHDSIRMEGVKDEQFKCEATQFIEVSSFPLPLEFTVSGTKAATVPAIETMLHMSSKGPTTGKWQPYMEKEDTYCDGYALNRGDWSSDEQRSNGVTMDRPSWPNTSFYIIPYVLDQETTLHRQVLERAQQIALSTPHPVRAEWSETKGLEFWSRFQDGMRESFDGGTFVPGPRKSGAYPDYMQFGLVLKSFKCSGLGCKYSNKIKAKTVQTPESIGFLRAATVGSHVYNAPRVKSEQDFPVHFEADFEEPVIEFIATMTYYNFLSQFLSYCASSQTLLFFLFPATMTVPFAFRFNSKMVAAAQQAKILSLQEADTESEEDETSTSWMEE